jgi:hypothetical protein
MEGAKWKQICSTVYVTSDTQVNVALSRISSGRTKQTRRYPIAENEKQVLSEQVVRAIRR